MRQATLVGIRGSWFTINGHPTCTPEAFAHADPNLTGTWLNVRAVQAIFDDANDPRQGSRAGDFGENAPMQPNVNSAFHPEGALKPAYAQRLEKAIAAADRLGMVVIAGLFYTGRNARAQAAPDERFAKAAIRNAVEFLHRRFVER